MAVAVVIDVPGGTVEQYKEMNRKMFGGKEEPDTTPEGLVIHTAGETGGALRIFDVWEKREDFERFVKQYVEPAMEGPAPAEPVIYELANVASPALTPTR
ncbi:MAG TPA: hypothetical protein VGQ84_11480 [Gaiellaceae bacterium]|jgi:hypothetical protein|nr:hypothetical protein [Gaiellaceae bacterium]